MRVTQAPLRRIRKLRGYGALAVAFTLAMALYLVPFPGTGIGVGVAVLLLILLFGGAQLWLAARTPDDALAELYPDPNGLPIDDRLRYFKRQLLFVGITFPAASWWTAQTLASLESGKVKSASLWAPIAFIYEYFGYWPAVLTIPLLGVLVCSIFAYKLNRPGA